MREPDDPFFLSFLRKEQLTSDCFAFYFKRESKDPSFQPGQYFEMKLKIENADERGDARVFTISSSPSEEEHYMFTTRVIQSSFKHALVHLKEGEIVEFNGPWDDIKFDVEDNTPCVFMAGGIGVTPYHSIVRYAIDKNMKRQMTLFVSWKNMDEMIFDDFFRSAQEKLNGFTYIPTLTEESSISIDAWDGETGRIDKEMIGRNLENSVDSKFYFSGPPAMVKALKEIVTNMGIKKENLISEDFEGY